MKKCLMRDVAVGSKFIFGQDNIVWLKIKTLHEALDESFWQRNVICIESGISTVNIGSSGFISDSMPVLLVV